VTRRVVRHKYPASLPVGSSASFLVMDGFGYSNEKLRDMHYFYGAAGGYAREAARMYQLQHPDRQHPHHSTFTRIHRALGEFGTFTRAGVHHAGRPRNARTVAFEEAVLAHVNNNPSTSTRAMASRFGRSQSTVWRVVNSERLHPYHLIKVHSLLPEDYPRRVQFAQWALQQIAENPAFLKRLCSAMNHVLAGMDFSTVTIATFGAKITPMGLPRITTSTNSLST